MLTLSPPAHLPTYLPYQQRANFIYTNLAFNLMLIILWEFSYSSYYGNYQFQLQIGFVFLFMQVSAWFVSALK